MRPARTWREALAHALRLLTGEDRPIVHLCGSDWRRALCGEPSEVALTGSLSDASCEDCIEIHHITRSLWAARTKKEAPHVRP